jgi:hypothetical protein
MFCNTDADDYFPTTTSSPTSTTLIDNMDDNTDNADRSSSTSCTLSYNLLIESVLFFLVLVSCLEFILSHYVDGISNLFPIFLVYLLFCFVKLCRKFIIYPTNRLVVFFRKIQFGTQTDQSPKMVKSIPIQLIYGTSSLNFKGTSHLDSLIK